MSVFWLTLLIRFWFLLLFLGIALQIFLWIQPCSVYNAVYTWRIAEDFDIWLLLSQHTEYHLSGCLGGTVQHPVCHGIKCQCWWQVHHAPSQTRSAWKYLQYPGSQCKRRANIEGQIGIHLIKVSETCKLGNVTQRAWEQRQRERKRGWVGGKEVEFLIISYLNILGL